MFGFLLNGLLPILVITWIVELFAFKKLEPDSRALFTTGTAFVVMAFLSLLVLDGQGYLYTLLFLALATVLAFLWRRHGYRKKWEEDEGVADDFV